MNTEENAEFVFEEKILVINGREYRQYPNGGLEDCKTGTVSVAPPHWVDGNGTFTYDVAQGWMDAMNSLGGVIRTVGNILERDS